MLWSLAAQSSKQTGGILDPGVAMCGAARRAARGREAGRDAGLTQGAQQGEGAARATRRARPRMVAKQPARSVTPTAPRASSTLNAWLSRSSWPYAGIGSRASSSWPASCAPGAK